MIEDKMRTDAAEKIIRFLARDENFGKKFTTNLVFTSLTDISFRKASILLSMFALKFPNIFGYEKIYRTEYFWIGSLKPDFVKWFKEWFKKEYG